MSLLGADSPLEKKQRPKRRRMLWIVGGVGFLAVLGVVGILFWANSDACENLIRRELIAKIETATGGRVEIGAFHWRPFRLEAEADGLVIHGRETAGEAPYAQIGRIQVGISILDLLSPRILLRHLEVTQPEIHLIVYADGSTNQPHPRRPSQSRESGMDRFLDLRAGHVAVEQGVLELESRATDFDAQDRRIPLNFSASDVSAILAYVPASGANPEMYRVEAGARDLSVLRGDPTKPHPDQAEGYAQASLDLTRNAAYLRSLRITSRGKNGGEHTLAVSGSLVDFSRPSWRAQAQGELDMRLLEPETGYANSPEGMARVNLNGQGRGGQFRIDGLVHVDGGSYIAPGVNARGVGLDAHVHADPEQLLI